MSTASSDARIRAVATTFSGPVTAALTALDANGFWTEGLFSTGQFGRFLALIGPFAAGRPPRRTQIVH